MLTTAQEIKNTYFAETTATSRIDWDGFAEACESAAIDVDQDWEVGSTTYTFEDGSKIVWADRAVDAHS